MSFPIAFHLTHQPNQKAIADRYGNSPLRAVIALQHQLFQLLLREPITLSLRYLYDPHASADQRLQIFLIFNTALPHSPEREQLELRLTSALQSSEFYQIYPFQLIDLNTNQFPTLQKLDWVKAITEIQKVETISPKGYYLPRLFPENPDHDMVKICEQLSRVGRERFLLEITLQPYNNPSERTKSLNALEAILKAHSKASNSAKDAILETVIKSAQNHQTNYSHKPLFTYSIKLLAEQEHSLSNLAISWLQNATNSDYASQCHPPILTRGSTEFQQSLQTTRQVRVAPLSYQHSPVLQNWHQEFGNQTVSKVFRGGGNSIFGDGSTAYSNPTPPPQPPTGYSLPNANPTSGGLVSGGSYGLSKATQCWTTSQPALMQDLLPLRHLVTLDEISSFLRVVIPDKDPPPPQKLTAEQIFNLYPNLITKDKYVVGMNDQGKIVSSDWNESPHRLVAGVTRCGKTNFLHWLIFQFLYTDPERKVYILDLKENNFRFYNTQLPEQVRKRVVIATKILECYELLKKVYQEYERRKDIVGDYQTIQEMVNNGGEYTPRLLLIVDEAALIPEKSKELKSTIPLSEQVKNPELANLQANIDRYLQYFATTGAGYDIHLMYCTQNPKSDVITTQVTSQLEERLIFRITSDTSAGIIGEQLHSRGVKIPEGKEGKGKVYMKGVEGSQYVYTPLIAVPPATAIDQTLWKLL